MPDDQYRYQDPATTQLPPLRRGGWVEDPSAPSGYRWERDITPSGSVTQILPAVPGGRISYGDTYDYTPTDPPQTFTHDDGSVYERPSPEDFDNFDDVDSTTIVDDGGPD